MLSCFSRRIGRWKNVAGSIASQGKRKREAEGEKEGSSFDGVTSSRTDRDVSSICVHGRRVLPYRLAYCRNNVPLGRLGLESQARSREKAKRAIKHGTLLARARRVAYGTLSTDFDSISSSTMTLTEFPCCLFSIIYDNLTCIFPDNLVCMFHDNLVPIKQQGIKYACEIVMHIASAYCKKKKFSGYNHLLMAFMSPLQSHFTIYMPSFQCARLTEDSRDANC